MKTPIDVVVCGWPYVMGEGVEACHMKSKVKRKRGRTRPRSPSGCGCGWIGYAAFLASVGVSAAAYGYASVADGAILTLVVGIALSLLLGVLTYCSAWAGRTGGSSSTNGITSCISRHFMTP